jgi:hypothetical protein
METPPPLRFLKVTSGGGLQVQVEVDGKKVLHNVGGICPQEKRED